jgi:hypothetical protein
MNEKEVKKKIPEAAAAFVVSAAFYLFFAIRYGVYLGSDSPGYINMISAREPVYPLLLAAFRGIFGEEHYLFAVILFQNLLMAAAVTMLCTYLKKRFALPRLIYALLFLPHFGEALLTQYAAKRAVVYTNSIMTEGITLSVWLLFMLLCFKLREKGLELKNAKTVLVTLLLCAFMTDIRKQMAMGYITLFTVAFFDRKSLKKPADHFKKIVLLAVGMALTLILALLGTRMYNYALRGEFKQNTRDMNLVLTTTLYVADKEDAKLIKEESVKDLFIKTMDLLDETKSNYSYAGKSLRELEEHYEENYDVITVNTTGPLFIDYAIQRGFKEGMEAEAEADRMSGVIVKSLLADNAGTYLKVYAASLINGFVNTIAARHKLLDLCALAAYIGFIALMVICYRKKECYDAAVIGMSVLTAILVNVGVTAALIFCQSRYMIYNMALFYQAGLIMLWELVKRGKHEKSEKDTD